MRLLYTRRYEKLDVPDLNLRRRWGSHCGALSFKDRQVVMYYVNNLDNFFWDNVPGEISIYKKHHL